MNRAYLRVVRNKGSYGVDGMEVPKLKEYLKANGSDLIKSIKSGKYRPNPVRRVEIPKDKTSKRPLGISTVVDRFVQQAIHQVLSPIYEKEFTDEIIDLYHALKKERESFSELGIDFEEKAFYDILKSLTVKYDFPYPDEKLLHLSKEVKAVVDDKAKYTDWSKRDDIKAE
ncbi:MAG: DUF3387 domain-containing protein, partial [Bacteroidales bacterium]